jgi:UDP-3-O-[3-hydroxymyristoyl] glucosamine N-acyltransferase
MKFTAEQIATLLGGIVEGEGNLEVSRLAKIEQGVPGAISFLANPKYIPYIYETESSVVLVNKDFIPEKPIKATLIRVEDASDILKALALKSYEGGYKIMIVWMVEKMNNEASNKLLKLLL